MLKPSYLFVLYTLLCSAIPVISFAKEGGDQSPNGAENWSAAGLPPPGNYFINIAGLWNGSLRNADGNQVRVPDVNNTMRLVQNRAVSNAFRFIHVTGIKFGNARYGWQVILPSAHRTADFPQLGNKIRTTGFADLIVSPVLLGWRHSEYLSTALAVSVFLPTGHYDNHDPRRNLGVNYMSIEPAYAVTWLQPDGWEASAKFMYNFKTERNDQTNYRSGDEFHVDFLLGRHFGKWGIGLSGFYLKQLEDDERDGIKIGNRGQVLGLGPSVKYSFSPELQVVTAWQRETSLRNRFGGDKFLLKLIVAL